jgi:hypothetical protein
MLDNATIINGSKEPKRFGVSGVSGPCVFDVDDCEGA